MEPRKNPGGSLALKFHVDGANISDIGISNRRKYQVTTYRRLDDPTLRPTLDEEPEGPFYSSPYEWKNRPIVVTYDNDGGIIPNFLLDSVDQPSRGAISVYRPVESDVLARNLVSCSPSSDKKSS